MDKSIYQDLYEFETEQRTHLASTVNIPIVASTAIGGAAVTMALSYPYETSIQANCFAVFLGLTGLSLAIAIYFVFRSLIGYEYERLPTSQNLRTFHAEMLKTKLAELGERKESEAVTATEKAFLEKLEERYSQAADINRANNQNRGRFTYSANVTLAVGTVMLALASGFYLYAKITKPPEIHHVKIIGEVKMSATTTEPAPVTTPKPEPEKPAPVTTPDFPPNEKFRDHTRDIPTPVGAPQN